MGLKPTDNPWTLVKANKQTGTKKNVQEISEYGAASILNENISISMCADVNIFYKWELLFKTYDKPSYAILWTFILSFWYLQILPKNEQKQVNHEVS